MREVYSLITRVAASSSTVLILGESGTGKEMVARAIHERSSRQAEPFMAINCSAVPETLLESELFGHQKGSFTGAIADKKGLFEEAGKGTLFLDEVGEISPPIQVKLLRVLQDGQFRPLGGTRMIRGETRVLSASNRNLEEAVRNKKFREDLYWRLNVIGITLPPLRDRKEDIVLLAEYFLKKYAERAGKPVEGISLDALEALQNYRWPGNVRELENAIERAVVLGEGGVITARDLPPPILGELFYMVEKQPGDVSSRLRYQESKQKALNLFNRNYISNVLKQTSGNVSMAADRAGMDRSNFKKLVLKSRINVSDFRKRRDKSR